jgi:hypothetical protein
MSDKNELTPAERELEQTLRSLRPTTARIDPEAAARAAGALRVPKQTHVWRYAAVAAMIAMAVGVWVTQRQRSDVADRDGQPAPEIETDLAGANEWSVPPLTFASYRQALARSPAELEALLDRQASDSALNQLHSGGVPTVWTTNTRASIGEM